MNGKGLVLVVIDGLTPSVFERAVETGEAPALAFLAANGRYARATSTFPSLTPVCVSSIATGAHPDVHHIPHLVWFDRDDRRVVEYGSSLGAIVAAGTRRALVDTIFDLSARHLSGEATTVFEALDDADLVTAAVNFTCYRGRTEHRATLPGVTRTVRGPRRFFFYNLFESDVTGAPLAVRRRAAGSIDEYAAAVGRWLVARDGFDFFVFYLADYDYASHALGPEGAAGKLADADQAIASLMDVAGGPDAFLERYAVVLCSDHGQTRGRAGDPARGRLRRSRPVPAERPRASRRRGLRLQPRRPGLPAAALRRARAGARRAARRPARGRRRDVPRGRQGRGQARRRGASLPCAGRRLGAGRRRRRARPPRWARPGVGGTAEPARGRRARVGRRGLRVHRPRRQQPRRRRQPRLPARGRLRGARCSSSGWTPSRPVSPA